MKKKNIIGTIRVPETHIEIKDWLKQAHKVGINWIDTAWVYGRSDVEQKIGKAIEELRIENNIIFKIQSKIWTTFYKKTPEIFHKQLAALKIGKIDSMLLHRPALNFLEDLEAWKELIKLQKQGLVETIGVSNYEKDQILLMTKATGVQPAINQIELSVSNFREDRVFFAHQNKIEVQAWSVFGKDVHKNLNHLIVQKLATKYEVAPGTILTSFLTSQQIIPIHASFKTQHLIESINTIKLTQEEIQELKQINCYDNKSSELYSKSLLKL